MFQREDFRKLGFDVRFGARCGGLFGVVLFVNVDSFGAEPAIFENQRSLVVLIREFENRRIGRSIIPKHIGTIKHEALCLIKLERFDRIAIRFGAGVGFEVGILSGIRSPGGAGFRRNKLPHRIAFLGHSKKHQMGNVRIAALRKLYRILFCGTANQKTGRIFNISG